MNPLPNSPATSAAIRTLTQAAVVAGRCGSTSAAARNGEAIALNSTSKSVSLCWCWCQSGGVNPGCQAELLLKGIKALNPLEKSNSGAARQYAPASQYSGLFPLNESPFNATVSGSPL